MKFTRKKITDYILNGLLILAVLIFLIPSWRISFQGWMQSLFLKEVQFSDINRTVVPQEAQNWGLFDMNSTLYNFREFKGKPIVMSFWATWCPPCRAELPELKSLKSKFENQVEFIAVSEETIEVIQASELHLDYTFLFSTTKIPAFYEVTSLPTLLIFDKELRIVFRTVGAGDIDNDENVKFLHKLIQES